MVDLALIPAAGQGVRAYPATNYVPKVMLEIAGKPLIQRNLEIVRDQMGVRDIVVIVGYLGEQVREYLGDGSKLGVKLRYVQCDEPKIGLARGIMLAEPLLDRPFVTILGDELYLGSNHDRLQAPAEEFFAVCGVRRTDNPRLIQKNYSVRIDGNRVVDVEEKPVHVTTDVLGLGTYVFTPELFERIRNTAPSATSNRIELTDVIRDAARRGDLVVPFELAGDYINVNSVEDFNYANYVARSREFAQYKVSVVIPAYNEEETIGYVVSDFVPRVDEVLVVDNSSRDRTAEVARSRGARVETVKLKGYGDTIKWGLDHAIGQILIVVEADHSFRAKDVGKMLEYLKDADMVMGTRTTRQMIEQGANMKGLLRWGNVVVGKIIEVLWWSQEPRFTDVGCTYRALWRDVWNKIRDRVHGIGPEFSPELMIEVLRARKRVVEIPVSYYARVGGESKHSQSFTKVARTALRMLRVIFAKRFGR
jgi:NDP-sugar pyrophosphorylase family protein